MFKSLPEKFRVSNTITQISLFLLFFFYHVISGRLQAHPDSWPNTVRSSTDMQLAHQLMKTGEFHTTQLRLDSALVCYQKASALFEKHNEWQLAVRCLNLMASNLIERIQYEEARKLLERAEEIGLRRLSQDHPEIANTYSRMGLLSSFSFDYDKTLFWLHKAIAIFEKSGASFQIDLAKAYRYIAIIYHEKGLYERCIEYNQKALKIFIPILGEQDIKVAVTYINLGGVYRSKGDWEQAIHYSEKALKITIAVLGEQNVMTASAYSIMGALLNEQGDYYQALQHFEKAHSILTALSDTTYTVYSTRTEVCSGMGETFRNLGDLNRALTCYKEELAIKQTFMKESDPSNFTTYKKIGDVLVRLNDLDSAMESYQKALNINLNLYGERHPISSEGYACLGKIQLLKRNWQQALTYFNKAVAISLELLGPHNPQVIRCRNLIAQTYHETADEKQALIYYHSAIKANRVSSADSVSTSLTLSRDYVSKNDLLISFSGCMESNWSLFEKHKNQRYLNNALAYSDSASALIDVIRMEFKAEGSKLLFTEKWAQVHYRAMDCCLKLYSLTNKTEYLNKAFHFAEKNKAMVLQAAIVDTRAKKYAGVPDTLLRIEKQIRTEMAYFETLLYKGYSLPGDKDSLDVTHLHDKIFSLHQAWQKLIADIEEFYPQYYQLKYNVQPQTVADIQRGLDEQSALVAYSFSETSLYAFIMTNRSLQAVVTRVDTGFFNLIPLYHRLVQNRTHRQFNKTAEIGQKLYQVLFAPIKSYVSSCRRLVIIPDGALFYIPFETLVGPAHDSRTDLPNYLIRQYEIVYHYSATLFSSGAVKRTDAPNLCFIGFAPIFDEAKKNGNKSSLNAALVDSTKNGMKIRSQTDGKPFAPIPGTEKELLGIIDLFKQARLQAKGYFRQQAREQLLKTLPVHDYLHIATHGFFNEQNPALSGLAFAPSDSSNKTDDGILYAGEIYNLDLEDNLVVLSSCDTGAGKLINGEGIISLTRGFLFAGADNIVFSLWKADDVHTSRLMIEFYRNILLGNSYSRALMQAKLTMLQEPAASLPGFWAPFVLIGN